MPHGVCRVKKPFAFIESQPNSHNPKPIHSASTRAFVASSIRISPGHGLVKPSVGHFRVASTPIFEP